MKLRDRNDLWAELFGNSEKFYDSSLLQVQSLKFYFLLFCFLFTFILVFTAPAPDERLFCSTEKQQTTFNSRLRKIRLKVHVIRRFLFVSTGESGENEKISSSSTEHVERSSLGKVFLSRWRRWCWSQNAFVDYPLSKLFPHRAKIIFRKTLHTGRINLSKQPRSLLICTAEKRVCRWAKIKKFVCPETYRERRSFASRSTDLDPLNQEFKSHRNAFDFNFVLRSVWVAKCFVVSDRNSITACWIVSPSISFRPRTAHETSSIDSIEALWIDRGGEFDENWRWRKQLFGKHVNGNTRRSFLIQDSVTRHNAIYVNLRSFRWMRMECHWLRFELLMKSHGNHVELELFMPLRTRRAAPII